MRARHLSVAFVFVLAGCDVKPATPAASRPPVPVPVASKTPSPSPAGSVSPSPSPSASPSPEPGPSHPPQEAWKVAPLPTEPVFPDPADADEVKKRGWIPFPSGYVFDRRDEAGKVLESGVVTNGLILMDRGLIELLGCAEGGKEHESIVRVGAEAQSLDFGLVLCGLKGGPVPERLGDPKVEQGPRLVVLLQWVDEETGKTVTYRAEDIVVFYDPKTEKNGPMPRVGWTYVGAMIEVPDPAAGKKPGRVLASSASRSLLTTWRDRTTLLDNPLPDAANDKLFAANYMVLPPPGTPVRVVIRTPREEERREIAKAEEAQTK